MTIIEEYKKTFTIDDITNDKTGITIFYSCNWIKKK